MTDQRIIYANPDGSVAVIIPTGEVPIAEVAAKDVPDGVPYEIITTDDIPADRTFRNAWKMGDCCIEHDLDRCREIAHDRRRAARADEFAPHDNAIAMQIPGVDPVVAEAQRQVIREKYAAMQDAIDQADTVEAIKEALET